MAEPAVKRILIVDDEVDFVELTSTMLGFYDYHVVAFSDPTHVIDALQKENHTLIVTDLMMPQVSGFQLIEKIRALAVYNVTPIIALSAKTLSDEERKFLLQNNVSLMVKPFEPQGLVDQIQNLLQRAFPLDYGMT